MMSLRSSPARKKMRLAMDVEESKHRSTLNDLNDDCLRHIFMGLPFPDRVRYERVCKRWKNILGDCWSDVRKLGLNKWDKWTLVFSKSTSLYADQEFASKLRTKDVKKILLLCGRYVRLLDIWSAEPFTSKVLTVKFIADNCNNIRKLYVRGLASFSCADLNLIISTCPQFECIKLEVTNRPDNASSCSFLETLHGQNMKEITIDSRDQKIIVRKSSAEAIREFPRLQRLNFFCPTAFCSGTLEIITENNQTLKEIDLHLANESVNQFNQSMYQSILPITNLRNLEILAFTGMVSINADFLNRLVINCQQLKHLSLANIDSPLPASMMRELGKLPALEMLEMQELRHAEFFDMSMLTTLKSFVVSRCQGIGNEALISLLHNANCLEFLKIGAGTAVHGDTVLEVATLVTYERLNGVVLKIDIYETNFETSIDYSKYDSRFLEVAVLGLTRTKSKNLNNSGYSKVSF